MKHPSMAERTISLWGPARAFEECPGCHDLAPLDKPVEWRNGKPAPGSNTGVYRCVCTSCWTKAIAS